MRKTYVKSRNVNIQLGSQLLQGCPENTLYDAFATLAGNNSGIEEPNYQPAVNAATIRAYAKLNRMEVGGGENAGTIRETLRMLKAPLSSVVKLGDEMVEQAKKRTQSTRDTGKYYRKLLNAVSDQWLQYRYGIMPLVYDARGLIKIADNRLWEWERKIHSVRATERHLGEAVVRNVTGTYGYASTLSASGTNQHKHKVTVIIYYVDKLHMKDAIALEELGLSPTQWPSLAYELMPLSFVADWAVNVGDWLKAIAPHPTIRILDTQMSYKKTAERHMISTLCNFSTEDFAKNGYSVKTVELIRTFNPPLPTSPGFTGRALSWKRQVDALTLSWNFLPGIINMFRTQKPVRRPNKLGADPKPLQGTYQKV
jgi:hypothetical protein